MIDGRGRLDMIFVRRDVYSKRAVVGKYQITGFSSQGRAKLCVFREAIAWKRKLNPSLTRKTRYNSCYVKRDIGSKYFYNLSICVICVAALQSQEKRFVRGCEIFLLGPA